MDSDVIVGFPVWKVAVYWVAAPRWMTGHSKSEVRERRCQRQADGDIPSGVKRDGTYQSFSTDCEPHIANALYTSQEDSQTGQ